MRGKYVYDLAICHFLVVIWIDDFEKVVDLLLALYHLHLI
jgi:hypothetical protein